MAVKILCSGMVWLKMKLKCVPEHLDLIKRTEGIQWFKYHFY